MRIVLALGGNALLVRGERPDADTQLSRLAAVGAGLRALAAEHALIVTHGNGPQIGLLARESEADQALERPYPLDALGAQTQGLIGYWLLRELDLGHGTEPAGALVTRVEVDESDPAFGAPTKFIGPMLTETQAEELSKQRRWTIARDGLGWRRVVASPRPISIPELPVIADLLAGGSNVVCCGGGGIPVARGGDGRFHGVEAVVDKDLTASLLAVRLRADALVLLTDVDGLYADYGTDRATLMRNATAEDLRAQNFATGSMGPKVQAACEFAEQTGGSAAIGSLSDALRVVAGEAGTIICSTSKAAETADAQVDAAWAISS
jgi:carbamate kinase